MTLECCCRRPHEFQFCQQPIPHTGCSDRERTVSESPLRPWKKDVAVAGGAQRRACWYVAARYEQVGTLSKLYARSRTILSTTSKQIEHVQFISTLSKGRNFTINSFDVVAVLATKSNVASTKSNVASTLLLVWTGLKANCDGSTDQQLVCERITTRPRPATLNKSPLLLTDPRDAVPHAHRVVHRSGRSG